MEIKSTKLKIKVLRKELKQEKNESLDLRIVIIACCICTGLGILLIGL